MSTSASRRLVAKVWRNMCGVMCRSMAAREQYLLIMRRTAWSERGAPDWFTKKWVDEAISVEKLWRYSVRMWITSSDASWR